MPHDANEGTKGETLLVVELRVPAATIAEYARDERVG
jgi:hypothetical protein